MESISSLFILVIIIFLFSALFNMYKRVKNLSINNDDIVLFILKEIESVYMLSLDLVQNKNDYEYLKDLVIKEIMSLIESSSLSDEIKQLATENNIALLVEPSLKYLYNRDFNKNSKIFTLLDYRYTEDEEKMFIEEETRFIYERLVLKKNKLR